MELSMYAVLVALFSVLVVLWMFKKICRYWRLSRCMQRLPGHPGSLFLDIKKIVWKDLELRIFALRICECLSLIYDKERLCKAWVGFEPLIFVFKPESVEALLTNPSAMEKGEVYKFLHEWLGKGLITSGGLHWKRQRKVLTPAFHFRILEEFLPIMNDQAAILVEQIRQRSATSDFVDVIPTITKCTLDIICRICLLYVPETAMGVKIHAQYNEDSEYVKAIQCIQETFTLRTTLPWLRSNLIFHLLPIARRYRRSLKIMHDFTSKVIRDKKEELISKGTDGHGQKGLDEIPYERLPIAKKRLAFLDLLLHYHIHDKMLTEEEVHNEVDTFMFAGHDTTALAITWALYLIGLYEHVQEKLHQEMDAIFGHSDKKRPVTTDDIKNMKYLDCVIKESQRLYPSVPLISRVLKEDLVVGGHVLPCGAQCIVLITMLHKNSDMFPRPQEFNPDRFLVENFQGRHPFAFIPFSAGPRNCIGQRFALNEEKVVISHILRNFKLRSLDPRDKQILSADILLKPKDPMRITFLPR